MSLNVGDRVLVVVPRYRNAGIDHRPGVVIGADAAGVRVHVHGQGDIDDAQVYPDRAAVDDRLAVLFADLPGHEHQDPRDAKVITKVGVSPLSGKAWDPADAADWHAMVYPLADDPAAAERAREAAATAAAAAKARRRAELAAELAELDEAA